MEKTASGPFPGIGLFNLTPFEEQSVRALVFLFAISVAFAALPALAGKDPGVIDRDDQAVMASKAFLDAHPDMKYRTEGFLAYELGDFAEARTHFLKAAEFADKPAQAMLAEMAWKGIGEPADRAMGYVWADLAAERGYRQFVALRERYWSELDAAGRERVLMEGVAVMQHYGDASAQPRLARHLRRARLVMITGRPRKDVTILVPGKYGMGTWVRGHDFYAPKFWEPKQYFEWVDAVWADPPVENVEVGSPEGVEAGREG